MPVDLAGFKLWSPEVYNDVYNVVERLRAHDKKITKNWAALAYPCAAFNFGPQVKCKPHKDSGNSPKTLCAIQAFGKFDPKKGGHLYIRELRLVIRFPAGSTILIPSALLTHGNTPVGPGEIRLSFTQFVPGGDFPPFGGLFPIFYWQSGLVWVHQSEDRALLAMGSGIEGDVGCSRANGPG